MDLKEPLDFSPKICFGNHKTWEPSLFRTGCLLHPLRHSQLISQGLICLGFSFYLTCDIISLTEGFTLFSDTIVIFKGSSGD